MKHSEVRNLPEFTQDMKEIRRRLLEGYTDEELLERLPAEKRLEGLPAEKRLEGLSPDELDQMRKLLEEKLSQKE